MASKNQQKGTQKTGKPQPRAQEKQGQRSERKGSKN
jgi:hypothetical protein